MSQLYHRRPEEDASSLNGIELGRCHTSTDDTFSVAFGYRRRGCLRPAHKVRQANYDGYKCSAKWNTSDISCSQAQ